MSEYFPRTSDHVGSYILGNELVLFSATCQRLFYLNTSAAWVWMAFEEGYSVDRAVCELSESFNVSKTVAKEDIRSIVQEWKAVGLLEGSDPRAGREDPVEPDLLPISGVAGIQIDYTGSVTWPSRCYRLLDTCFRIRYGNNAIQDLVHPLFRHVEMACQETPDIPVDVVQVEENTYVLAIDSKVMASCNGENEIAPLVHGHILLTVYNLIDHLFALHAAVVCHGDRCILLPGASGSGKSTLTAALVSSGLNYGTDELALVMSDNYLRSVPLSIGLKEGSWSVLGRVSAEIGQLPTFLRYDRKTVRYLSPQKEALSRKAMEGIKPGHVVFPVYDEGSRTVTSPLTPAQAICRITEAGYDVAGQLDAGLVQRLIDWVRNLECLELRYSDILEATDSVKRLLS